MKRKVEIEFIKHRTSKHIFLSFMRGYHPKLSDKKILKLKTDFEIFFNKKIKNAQVTDVIKTIDKQGYWGFCDHAIKHIKIHYWFKSNVKKSDLINLFSHELGHALGYSGEKKACEFGFIAEQAYTTLNSILKKKRS